MMLVAGIITFLYVFVLLFLLYGYHQVPEFTGKNSAPKTPFSIIIPFRDEAENLPQLLKSLSRLHYPAHLFEILLVNDASEDASEEICSSFIRAHPRMKIRLLQNERHTGSPKKDAVKTAISEANFDHILTTDADCTMPATWLEVFDSFIAESGADLVAAPVRLREDTGEKGFWKRFQELDIFSLQTATVGGFGVKIPFMCNGANLCYSKNGFLKVQGFEGNENIGSGDDIFLLEKFNREGLKTRFLKSQAAVVTTHPQPDLKSLVAQRIRWAAKTSAYKSPFGKFVGLIVLLMNLTLVTAVGGFLLNQTEPETLFLLFVFKFNADFALIYASAKLFDREKVLKSYFQASLVYPFFSSYVAILSLFRGYNWKGRQFKK